MSWPLSIEDVNVINSDKNKRKINTSDYFVFIKCVWDFTDQIITKALIIRMGKMIGLDFGWARLRVRKHAGRRQRKLIRRVNGTSDFQRKRFGSTLLFFGSKKSWLWLNVHMKSNTRTDVLSRYFVKIQTDYKWLYLF